jgi:hypothetical protein
MCNEIGAVAIFYILTFIRLDGRQNVARLWKKYVVILYSLGWRTNSDG